MTKVDLTKTDPDYYKPAKTPRVVELDALPYLQIVGVGAPEEDAYQGSIGALYQVAYSLKFQYKENEQDFVVPKLETYWWVESGLPFTETPKAQWHWKLTLRLPDFVSAADAMSCISSVSMDNENPFVASVQYAQLNEGKCIQALHVGPYEEQGETINKLMDFASQEDLNIIGEHHEIYLSDPKKSLAKNLKTLIRYSVA